MIWDYTLKRNTAILVWILLLAFSVGLFDILDFFGYSIKWIIFVEIVWYAFDFFIAAWMWHVFKLKKSDLPGIPTLTEVDPPELIVSTGDPETIPESTETSPV